MPDLDQLRLDAIYSVLAPTTSVLTPNSSAGPQDVHAIDKTAGVEVGGGEITVASIAPACDVRVTELASVGLAREDLDQGTIELNGNLWRIISTLPRPGINGEASGEVRLILQAAEAASE